MKGIFNTMPLTIVTQELATLIYNTIKIIEHCKTHITGMPTATSGLWNLLVKVHEYSN